MADYISQITLPDNHEYDIKAKSLSPRTASNVLTGTGTVGSYTNNTYYPAKWTFNTGSQPNDGDIVTIKIPVAGHDYGVFMSVDNGLHYYPVVLNGTGRITTHYPVNTYITVIFESTGSAASMYALAGQTSSTRITVTGGVWRVLNYYDSNNNDTGYYHRRIYPNLKAGGAIHPYSIIMQLPNGRWSGITTTAPNNPGKSNVSPVATGKTANASGFMLGHVLLMYANTTYADANNIGTYNIWSAHTGLIDARYSFNLANSTGNGFVAYTPVYIVGTVSDSLFHLDATKWWTQTLPSSDDGKVYIYIGDAYDWYRLTFTEDKPMYWYKDGAIRLYSGASEYALSAPLSGISDADDLKAIEAISDTSGLLKKTAVNTWTLDTNTYLTTHRTYTAVSGKKPTSNQTPGFGSTFDIEQVGQDTTGQISVTERTVTIPSTEASISVIGLVGTGAQTFSGVKTFMNGIEIKGHIAGDSSGTTGHGLYGGGMYHNAYNNIILHGDASTGSSGIAFVSDKVSADGTITNRNAPSDRAFIQYHACGVTTATAEGTNPTLASGSEEAGRLVIGIGNDSGDKIILQAPGDTDIVHQKGATGYPIPHTTNTNGSVGGTTTPVYVDAGVIKAGTALGASAYHSDSYFAPASHGTHVTTATVKSALGTVSTTAKKFLKDTGDWTQVAWGDLTGVPSSFTPSAHDHNRLNSIGRLTTAAAIAYNPSASQGFKLVWNIYDSSSRTNDATNSPSFDAGVINIPWDWGGYNGQIAISNTVKDNTRMQIRSASHIDNGESANPRYTPNYGAWREVVTATKATKVGDTNKPVYINATGQATAISYTIEKSVPSNAVFTDHYDWDDITNKPTTLSGYGIADAKIASGIITLGSNTITPITSIAELTGSTITATDLRTNLGLSAALRFIGKTTTDMSESTTTAPTVTGVTNYVPGVGDVVLDKNSDAEYVCIAKSGSTYTWELLGRSGSWATSTHTHGNITNGGLLGAANMAVVTDGSKKITTADLSVSDSNASTSATTTFVQAVTQNAQGQITVTKASLDTSGTWSGNAETASSAEKLTTARNLGVALGSTTAVTFDGSANQTSIPVSGTLDIAHGGTGATSAEDARTNLNTVTGNARVFYGTCNTAAATTLKEIVCAQYDKILTIGDMLIVKFDNTNSGAVGSLQITVKNSTSDSAGTTAKNIKRQYNGTGANNLVTAAELNKDSIAVFVYNGTYWILTNADYNNTYSYDWTTGASGNGRTAETAENGGVGIHRYSLQMMTLNLTWSSLSSDYPNAATTNGAATNKTIATCGFLLNSPIIYQDTNANAIPGNSANVNGYTTGSINLQYSTTNAQWSALTIQKPVYLIGTLQFDGTFKLNATKWWTQTLPTSDDGQIYIFLGMAYSATNIYLHDAHPIYWCKNGEIQPYTGYATATSRAAITTTTNAVAYYTNTTGTFGSKASANGALYATSANGALQWGILPIAQGGTNKSSWTNFGIVYTDNDGFKQITAGATSNNQQVLISHGAAAPDWYSGLSLSGTEEASYIATFKGTTASTSTTSGALKVAGGLGVAGQVTAARLAANGSNTSYNLYVNGTSYFKGNVTHDGIVYFKNDESYYINKNAQGYLDKLQAGNIRLTENKVEFYTTNADVSQTSNSNSLYGDISATAAANTSTPAIMSFNIIQGASLVNSNFSFNGDIIPQSNATYSLGSVSLHWETAHINNTILVSAKTQSISSYSDSSELSYISPGLISVNINGTISQNGSGYYLINAGQQYARLYIQAIGKTDSIGQSVLELGNNIDAGTANNSYGTLHLYNTDDNSATYTATGWTGSGISDFTILGATSTTQNAAAWSTLILGNDKNVTTTDPHSQGLIRIYSKGTVYTDIQSQVATSGSHTVYLPKYGNDMYLAHVGDNNAVGSGTQPVYVAENGRITASTNTVGDAYTPVYSNEGVLTATAPVQYNTFTIVSADTQVDLNNDAYTADTYVLTIVITSGEANINAPITWTSSTGKVRLQTSVAVSGNVSGYILTARGTSLVT